MDRDGSIEVLIIDDMPSRRRMLTSILGRLEGFRVVAEAGTPSEGIQGHRYSTPDVVLLDIGLGVEEAILIIVAIRASTPEAKVVVVESAEDQNLHSEVARAGACGFVRKPVEPERLVKQLQEAAAGCEESHESSSEQVLVASDDPHTAAALCTALVEAGHEPIGPAATDLDLLTLCQKHRPPVLILDLQAPVGDAAQMVSKIVTLDHRIRVISLGQSSDARRMSELIRAGAWGLLFAPFDQERIQREVARVLRLTVAAPRVGAFDPALQCEPPSRPGSHTASPESAPGARPSVVVIDDQAMMRRILQKVVEMAGCEIVGEAETGRLGMELFDTHRPDLVLLDIMLPDASGLELLTAMRQRQPGTRVIMITSEAERQTVETALARGAAGYLLKPFKPARVAEEIRRAMGLTA